MRPWCKLRNRYSRGSTAIYKYILSSRGFSTIWCCKRLTTCRMLMPLGHFGNPTLLPWVSKKDAIPWNSPYLDIPKLMPNPCLKPRFILYIYIIYIYMIPIHMDFLCIYVHSTLKNRKRVQSPGYTNRLVICHPVPPEPGSPRWLPLKHLVNVSKVGHRLPSRWAWPTSGMILLAEFSAQRFLYSSWWLNQTYLLKQNVCASQSMGSFPYHGRFRKHPDSWFHMLRVDEKLNALSCLIYPPNTYP